MNKIVIKTNTNFKKRKKGAKVTSKKTLDFNFL